MQDQDENNANREIRVCAWVRHGVWRYVLPLPSVNKETSKKTRERTRGWWRVAEFIMRCMGWLPQRLYCPSPLPPCAACPFGWWCKGKRSNWKRFHKLGKKNPSRCRNCKTTRKLRNSEAAVVHQPSRGRMTDGGGVVFLKFHKWMAQDIIQIQFQVSLLHFRSPLPPPPASAHLGEVLCSAITTTTEEQDRVPCYCNVCRRVLVNGGMINYSACDQLAENRNQNIFSLLSH